MVNPFTKKDDESLVKYIAVNNPRRKGRLGTNLYQQLVENVCARSIIYRIRLSTLVLERKMAMGGKTFMVILASVLQVEARVL